MWKTSSVLIGIALLLTTLGVIMLASASPAASASPVQDPFVLRQVCALVFGLIVATVVARMDYHRWRSLALPIAIVAAVLLALVLVPGVGRMVKGSQRWLPLGPLSLQPSEVAKIALVLLMSWWMSRVQRKAESLVQGLLVPLVLMGVLIGLVFKEPDFGTTMLMGTVGMAIMFAGGARISYLLTAGALGFSAISLAIMQNAERMRRIIAFLNPDQFAQDEAFQLLNAIYAFVVGGRLGVGLGGSLQKRHYLPEAHTDFIFAIVGEELGLVASLLVLTLFLGLFVCGLRISYRAMDSFGRLVAFGITAMITLQAAINIGVVTGCLPTKGLPLPFMSYGGTSLTVTLVMVGILVNIALQSGGEHGDDNIPVIKDKARHL